MCNSESELITNGQYVIFYKKDYKKLHLLSVKNSCIFLRKDKVELATVFGKKMGSTFKMVPKAGFNRHFTLQLCSVSDISSAGESFKDLGSGLDNRSICDDGSSQSLTSDSIDELRECGTTPKAIIEQLVENSKTFQIKTEYSQEKYIKKKENKYFEFITIRHPTIRLLAEIFSKSSIRVDTLSQLTTALNFQPDGSYILVENGLNGLVSANLLNSLSDEGKLIHITPSNQNQKQAVLSMNFPSSRMSQLITVRFSTLMELMEKRKSIIPATVADSAGSYNKTGDPTSRPSLVKEDSSDVLDTKSEDSKTYNSIDVDKKTDSCELRKRKFSSSSPEIVLKKPRWAEEAELAMQILSKKVDGLMIACRECPSTIIDKLLVYLLPSRPFAIYSFYQEPLVALYVTLKKRHDVIYLRITETWLRPYQVLPDRTHPAVVMDSSSGYLLSGIKVVNG